MRNVYDKNYYSWGRIGKHNVIITLLPAGGYGTNAAAITANSLGSSLPHIRISLLVGIGGGVPRDTADDLGKNAMKTANSPWRRCREHPRWFERWSRPARSLQGESGRVKARV